MSSAASTAKNTEKIKNEIEPPRRQGAMKYKNNNLAAKAAKSAKNYKIGETENYRIVTGKGVSR